MTGQHAKMDNVCKHFESEIAKAWMIMPSKSQCTLLPNEPKNTASLKEEGVRFEYKCFTLKAVADGYRKTLHVRAVDKNGHELKITHPSILAAEFAFHNGVMFKPASDHKEELNSRGTRNHRMQYSMYKCAYENCRALFRSWVWNEPNADEKDIIIPVGEPCYDCGSLGHLAETCCAKIGYGLVEVWPHKHESVTDDKSDLKDDG